MKGTRTERWDAIVVGAGPAGASAAFHLARHDVRVLMLDRARFPRGKACAECLSPQASRILADMDVLDQLEPRGARMRGILVRSPDGTEARGAYAAAHGYRGYGDHGLSIRREILDAALVDSARRAGAVVREGTRVVDLMRERGRVCGVVIGGSDGDASTPCPVLRTGVVIGADGLRSLVARRLGLARSWPWPRRLAVVAHYVDVARVGDAIELHVERDGFVGIADVGDGITTVAAVFPRRRAPEWRGDAAGFLHGWLMSRPQLAARFRNARPDGVVRVTGPFASHARKARAPGAFLVGDAADFFDPFTGEGIYAGLRGGELVTDAVLRALDGATDAGAAYDAARRREFGGKWMVEYLVGIGVASPHVMNRATRAMAAQPHLADLLAGVTGDFVPAGRVLRPGFLARLLLGGAMSTAPVCLPAAASTPPAMASTP